MELLINNLNDNKNSIIDLINTIFKFIDDYSKNDYERGKDIKFKLINFSKVYEKTKIDNDDKNTIIDN